MIIYYNPDFTGETYLDLGGHPLLMDTLVVNTIGLVQEIESRLGIHYDSQDTAQRLVAYCGACGNFFAGHKDNIFFKSFELDPLNVSRELLKWRDELVLASWKDDEIYNSDRLATLAGIESFWKKNIIKGVPDRIRSLLSRDDLKGCLPEGSEIYLNTELALLHPAIKKLISRLGINISVIAKPTIKKENNLSTFKNLLLGKCQQEDTLKFSSRDPKTGKETLREINVKRDNVSLNGLDDDQSLRILEFPNEQDALRYISSSEEFQNYDVWIDSDSKALDNWLFLQGRPNVGSSVKQISQEMQFLQVSIMLFHDEGKAVNAYTLLQWLYSPVNPISTKFNVGGKWMNDGSIFMHTLAETIVRCGGSYHPRVRQLIDNYRNGKEIKDHIQSEEIIKERRQLLEQYFDPVWNNDCSLFLDNMKGYSEESDSFIPLLKDKPDDTDMADWMNNLLSMSDERQYHAEVGCPWLVTNPAQLATPSRATLWCDCYNVEQEPLSTDFLTGSELKELEDNGALFWKADNERRFNEIQQMMPVLMTTERLTLVTCQQKGSNPVQKHPLIIRLETAAKDKGNGINTIITRPATQVNNPCGKNNPCFDNASQDKYKVQLTSHEALEKTAEKIDKKEHESQTSLNTLVQYPLDYFFNYILNLQPEGTAAMGEVIRLRGIVAHAIIEHIFDPKNAVHKGTASEIEQYYNLHYDEVFDQQVRENGGVFLLDENHIALDTLRGMMRNVIDHLLAIIRNNSLVVVGCEADAQGNIPGLKPITGSIDMLLKDENDNPVIFDFKYSASRHYRDLLVNNTSIQLLLYKEAIARDRKRNPNNLPAGEIRSGYFQMPSGTLYTTSNFVGKYVVHKDVSSERCNKDLLRELINSYNYRMKQFRKGFIETAEGQLLSDMDKKGNTVGEGCRYAIDKERNNVDLIPLETENTSTNFETLKKKANGFSDYTLFK